MDILDKLREETKGAHDRLEAVALSDKIMDGSLQPEEYKKLIRVHYLVHRDLENLVEKNDIQQHFPELHFEERKKMPLLKKDVEELSIAEEKLQTPATGQLPEAGGARGGSPYGLLGIMYVMEGATLGGNVIVKSLRKNEHLSEQGDFHYFGCYGPDTGKKWKSFLEVLKEKGQEPEAQSEIVAGARATYELFEENFKKFL